MILSSLLSLWIVHCIILKKRDVRVDSFIMIEIHLSAFETLHFACFINATRPIMFGIILI